MPITQYWNVEFKDGNGIPRSMRAIDLSAGEVGLGPFTPHKALTHQLGQHHARLSQRRGARSERRALN